MLKAWFLFVENWGYLGVFLLMALESSIVPIPSEIVMPPAAYWAAQGKMSFWGVVMAGTFGSYFGSIVSYYVAQWLGEPLLKKYGKYFLMSEKKIEMTQEWIKKYGVGGIFIARLLPVIRHLISMPAGIFRMPVKGFSIATIAGAFLWCLVLSWFGMKVIGDAPALLESPEEMIHVLKDKMKLIVMGICAFAAAYSVVIWFKMKAAKGKM